MEVHFTINEITSRTNSIRTNGTIRYNHDRIQLNHTLLRNLNGTTENARYHNLILIALVRIIKNVKKKFF